MFIQYILSMVTNIVYCWQYICHWYISQEWNKMAGIKFPVLINTGKQYLKRGREHLLSYLTFFKIFDLVIQCFPVDL